MSNAGVLPYFDDTDGNRWEVLAMNFCIDFGGRQCQIECQRNNNDGTYPSKTFVVYGVSGYFFQWDSTEIQHSEPEADSRLYKSVMQLFRDFDEVQNSNFKVPD
jgi:hypothetical protein